MKLRVLIADDEPLSRERLRRFLGQESHIEVVAECVTGRSTVEAIQNASPDVVFLDIRMPDLDGFEVIENLQDGPIPAIVFVTGFSEFASRAFDLEAIDYLLKPYDQERFRKALDRARDRLASQRTAQDAKQVARLLAVLQNQQKSIQRLTVKAGSRHVVINASDIDWVSSADNYTELHVGKTTHLLRTSISALAQQLSKQQFVRISRSVMVNIDRISHVRSKSHGDAQVALTNGTTLIATRTYRDEWKSIGGALD